MDCFLFEYERSHLQNQMYPSSNLSIAESSSYSNSYSLNSFSASSGVPDSLSISTAEFSISTAESRTGIFSMATVYEKVAEPNSGDGPSPKTPTRPPPSRLLWTVQLHKIFVDAVNHLGIENAVPETILQLMNVESLTVEDVATHLATYRVSLKKMKGLTKGGRSGGGGGGGIGGEAHSYSLSSEW